MKDKDKDKRCWLMRIFGRDEKIAGNMEIADDLEERYAKEPKKSPECIICHDCAGDMEILDDIAQREKDEAEEKKKIDKRFTSPIKRANGGG